MASLVGRLEICLHIMSEDIFNEANAWSMRSFQ